MNPIKTLLCTVALAATATFADAWAQSPAARADQDGLQLAQAAASDSTDMAEGEVRKVDKETKKITLKHGEIKSLEMPGMTMVFQVKDAALLDMVKPGDKVRFKAEKQDGALVVTEMQAVK